MKAPVLPNKLRSAGMTAKEKKVLWIIIILAAILTTGLFTLVIN